MAEQAVTKTPSESFYGIEIWDATGKYYISVADISTDILHNRPTSSNITYNSKYPFHIHDGMASYFSGSASAKFVDNCTSIDAIEIDKIENDVTYCCPPDRLDDLEGHAGDFVLEFCEWLHNDLVKYLRLSKKHVIPVGILDTVKVNVEENYTLDDPWNCTVSFDWEQLYDRYVL